MRVVAMSSVLLGAAGLLVGSACVGSSQLTGSGGGAGTVSSGRAGSQVMTGGGGSGPSGAGGTGPMECAAIARSATPVTPDVLIVLDTSASMNDGFDGACASGCGASSKWAEAVASIESVADGSTSAVANWGLELMNDGTNACATGGVAVSAGPATGGQIRAALSARSTPPGLALPGNTPARAAIRVAAANRLGATDLGQQIIVLVTDGVPDCMPGATDPLATDADGAIQAVTDATTAGIGTCVIGLGTAGGPADATLAQMAVYGSCPVAPAYTPVSSGPALTDALNAIGALGAACQFVIPPPPTTDGTTTRGNISVFINQTPIQLDPNNGWTYANAAQTVLQLRGSACTASRGQTVSVIFNCLTE